MIIREEQADDDAAIGEVTAAAFADVEHSDQSEPLIVERLRASGDLLISLVAVVDDVVVGHLAFSPVKIDEAGRGWFGLGPVSVDPAHQRRGIGSALIRRGLDRLREMGAEGCVVLGDPGYYPRLGFERDDRLRYEGAPAEYFMRIVLAASSAPAGRVDYAPAFG